MEIENVRVLFGAEGIRRLFEDELHAAEPLYLIGTPRESIELWRSSFSDFAADRVRRETKIKAIAEAGAGEVLADDPLIEARYLPPGHKSRVSISIYGAKAGMIFWVDEPIVLMVNDKAAAGALKTYFDILWARAGDDAFKREIKNLIKQDTTVLKEAHAGEARSRWLYGALSLGIMFAFLLVWEGLLLAFDIPHYLLPAPRAIAAQYVAMSQNGQLWFHTWVTLKEVMIGFAFGGVLGIALGYLLGKHKLVERVLYPYIIALQSAPKIILAPLIIIWLGFGIVSKIVLVTLVVFFPILINTVLGIEKIDRNMKDLTRLYKVNFWQRTRFFELPAILPELFAGFKTGATLAVIGAVVGEFVGAKAGLGYLAIYASGLLDTATVFVATLQLILLGIVLFGTMRFLEKKFLPWKENT